LAIRSITAQPEISDQPKQDYTAYPCWEVGGRVIAAGATGKFSGVTPSHTNALSATFKRAFDDTRFTDLSGQGRSLSASAVPMGNRSRRG
jgi:hypothetical protein